jgi:peptidase S41-like protein/WD40 repeat protein
MKLATKLPIAILLMMAGPLMAIGQSPAPALFGRLTVNQTHIVFSYAGDLWSVERGGGDAKRLTTHPGEESFPVFSPDGSQLAFSRQIGGNWDLYVMPASGGETRQITFSPRNDYANGWTPDGTSILFMSNLTGVPRLYTIRLGGVLQNGLPLLPEAINGSFSPDGRRIAYAPTSAIGDWRFYRGGSKGQVWLANPINGEIEKLPQGTYNDDFPVWAGSKIYFLSDRTGITPDYLIEWLRRQPIYYYTFRDGDDIATPVNPGPSAKVLIVNQENFSAAETFAFMYKIAKVGPIVGKRTGGGGIGPYVYTPRFVDGGNIQLPNRAAYNPDGTSWGIENVGVIPDYEVEIMPKDALAGRDPQLEKAIQVGLEEIRKNVPLRSIKPKYPVHK